LWTREYSNEQPVRVSSPASPNFKSEALFLEPLFLFRQLGAFEKLRKVIISFVMYVPTPTWNKSLPMIFDMTVFFENCKFV